MKIAFKYTLLLVLFLSAPAYGLSVLKKISAHYTSFIEETIQINIPGIDKAYNASIIEYEDGYLMAFRYDTYIHPVWQHRKAYHQFVGIIQLDENFIPKGPWLPFPYENSYDPRLCKIGDTTYIIFASPNDLDRDTLSSSRLNLCAFSITLEGIHIDKHLPLKVPFQNIWEKNWVLFDYDNKPYLSYTIDPHVIVKPSLINGDCKEISRIQQKIHWPYGIIRGGTPAIKVDGTYLGFFHSSAFDPATGFHTFYVGAYTFSPEPPFQLLKISSAPFSHPDFFSTPRISIAAGKSVVFPGGFFVKEDKLYVCYGENDAAIKIMVIDKKKLMKSLVPVRQPQN